MTEPTPCATTESDLLEEAAGRLDEAGRARLHAHWKTCAACRERAARHDPSVVFLALGSEPVPETIWDGFEAGLRARIEREAAQPAWRAIFRPGLARYPKIAWAAPALMALVLGATLFVVQPNRQRSRVWPRPPRPPARAAVPLPGAALLPDTPATAAAPGMEGVAAPGARVYRFSVGEPGDETSIYFVVDDSIDL